MLEDAILVKMDCEKGEGPAVAKKYGVRGYPTFLTLNHEGEVTGGLLGYEGPEKWAAWVALEVADQRTVAQKKAAFEKQPTKELACSLANHTGTSYDFPQAVKYYKAARDLDPANAAEYTDNILTYMYYGSRGQAFELDEILAEGDRAMGAEGATPEDKLNIAGMMAGVTATLGQPDKAIPFLKIALDASEGVAELAEQRLPLEIEYALYVSKDLDRAVQLKRQGMDDGWQDDADQLNSFAWWCFEHGVNLAEAEELALKGAELAETDKQKANILDTAAEICAARGNGDQAIARIKQAMALDPEKQYFKEQLARFEKEALAKGEKEG